MQRFTLNSVNKLKEYREMSQCKVESPHKMAMIFFNFLLNGIVFEFYR